MHSDLPDRNPRKAFTLVEFLIVVAIVLILLAVATPSFLEAQTRTNISTARVRMEAMKQAMLAHRADWGSVPADFNDSLATINAYRIRSATDPACTRFPGTDFATDGGLNFALGPTFRETYYANNVHCPLTSPIRYLDPSQTIDPFSDGTVPFGYDSREVNSAISYGVFTSAGPDLSAGQWIRGCDTNMGLPVGCAYNPTNGTTSSGEFWSAISQCDGTNCPNLAANEFIPLEWLPTYDTDLNDDGNVDDTDLLILMRDWGKVSGAG
ncbi:MAG: prepilin-type N-terminal cleavage/methylation domain-containing protein [Candidatus Omnitrophica bacterium]|nr:prepilin-type N-terminal cleavage/methylation domain-containing protein [Candidatus Omnitrophota bacterium]